MAGHENNLPDRETERLLHFAGAVEQQLDQLRAAKSAAEDGDLLNEISRAEVERLAGLSLNEALAAYQAWCARAAEDSVVGALPLMLRLRNRPYTLEDHYPMEPIFRKTVPPRLLLRSGRQVSKSTTLAAQAVIHSGLTPYFNSLFVTPLCAQTRRLSSNYVRPFITDSPLFCGLVDAHCEQSVFQRSFRNHSILFFSYCLRDADRVRGISADRVIFDEVQDIDFDLLPVVMETLSASRWGVVQGAGTPKTSDNAIEKLWSQSSQAEWVTKCAACGYYNIAALAHDLWKMIGPETVSCARCSRPINPRPAAGGAPDKRGGGFWAHAWPDRAEEFPGYHTPQVIFPMHYAHPEKWRALRRKMDPAYMARNLFINDVLGECADLGIKLITHQDIVRACQIYQQCNEYRTALLKKDGYLDIAVGVDWGGSTAPYGAGRSHLLLDAEQAQSSTVLAVAGLKPDAKIDVLFLHRFELGHHLEEAQTCLSVWGDFDAGRGSTLFAHDYGGGGGLRETLIIQAGLPLPNICGYQYVHAPQQQMVCPRAAAGRAYWSLDKARSLTFLCQCLKSGFIGLPEYNSFQPYERDFLSLTEDKIARPGAADIFRVIRQPGVPDDAAHAVNYAAVALWDRHRRYPNLGAYYEKLWTSRFDASSAAVDRDSQPKRRGRAARHQS